MAPDTPDHPNDGIPEEDGSPIEESGQESSANSGQDEPVAPDPSADDAALDRFMDAVEERIVQRDEEKFEDEQEGSTEPDGPEDRSEVVADSDGPIEDEIADAQGPDDEPGVEEPPVAEFAESTPVEAAASSEDGSVAEEQADSSLAGAMADYFDSGPDPVEQEPVESGIESQAIPESVDEHEESDDESVVDDYENVPIAEVNVEPKSEAEGIGNLDAIPLDSLVEPEEVAQEPAGDVQDDDDKISVAQPEPVSAGDEYVPEALPSLDEPLPGEDREDTSVLSELDNLIQELENQRTAYAARLSEEGASESLAETSVVEADSVDSEPEGPPDTKDEVEAPELGATLESPVPQEEIIEISGTQDDVEVSELEPAAPEDSEEIQESSTASEIDALLDTMSTLEAIDASSAKEPESEAPDEEVDTDALGEPGVEPVANASESDVEQTKKLSAQENLNAIIEELEAAASKRSGDALDAESEASDDINAEEESNELDDSEVVAAAAGGTTDVNALISELGIEEDVPEEEAHVSEPDAMESEDTGEEGRQVESGESIDEAELEKFLTGMGIGDETPEEVIPESEHETTEPEITASEPDEIVEGVEGAPTVSRGLLSQEELDALADKLRSSESGEASTPEPQASEDEAIAQKSSSSESGETVDPGELDRLLNDLGIQDEEPSVASTVEDEVSPEETAAESLEVPTSPDGLLTQGELDALAAKSDATHSASEPAQESEPMETEAVEVEPVSAEAGETVDQSELDKLLSDLGLEDDEESTPSDMESVPEAVVEEDSESSSSSGLLDQSELDRLVADLGPAPPSKTSGTKFKLSEPTASDADGEEEPAVDIGGQIDQSELDALLNQLDVREAATEDSGGAAPSESEQDAVASEDSESISQEELDRILADAQGEQAAEDEEPAATEGFLDQSELDALMANLDSADAEIESALESRSEEEGTSVGHEAELSEGAASDEEIASVQTDDATPLGGKFDDTPLVEQQADEQLVQDNMEERLDGEADLEELGSEQSAEEPGAIEPEPDLVAADVGEESVAEAVAGENIAAGAAETVSESLLDADAVEPVASEALLAADDIVDADAATEAPEPSGEEAAAAEVSGDDSGGTVIGFPLPSSIKRQPARAITSIAAGLIVGIATILYMITHPLQPLTDLSEFRSSDPGALRQSIYYAEGLMDEGRHAEAVAHLKEAIESAPDTAGDIPDARYLYLEAAFESLPEEIRTADANAMHSQIDRLVSETRGHPRAPEALVWKAQVYFREDNALAARAEYRLILDSFGNASNTDDVLLRLGQLELDTERPVQAVRYLQQLIRNYPTSALVPRGRLLLGEAFADAGDTDNARGVFIRLAEDHVETPIGAQAFEHLGELALDMGDYAGAIRELEVRLETATSIEGNDRVYLILARSYHKAGDLQKARDILNELLDFFPESDVTPAALVELSQILNGMGMGREAMRLATESVERYPANVDVLRNTGNLLAAHGDALAAGRSLMAAHRAGASDPVLLLAAGRHFKDAGALRDAKDTLEELLNEFPTTPQALEASVEWSRVAFLQGNVSQAVERLTRLGRATEGQSRRLPIIVALSEMYEELGLMTELASTALQIAGVTEDPRMLAKATIDLVKADAIDDARTVADRVAVTALPSESAYEFLMAQGAIWLQRDSGRALELMEQAHSAYPDEHTPEGVQNLLEVNLTKGRLARARSLVATMQDRVAKPEFADERPWLHRAAATWGDHLFERGDYRAAADAYAIAMDTRTDLAADATIPQLKNELQYWSAYQRANSLFNVARYTESLPLFERVVTSGTQWAPDAEAQLNAARLELRLRGEPVGEPRNAG